MEHIDEEQKAMKEILRILKPGGKAILQVPLDYKLEATFEDDTITGRKEREEIFGQYDHLRIYGKDYGMRLEKAGFKVEVNRFIDTLSDDLRDRYRLADCEWIFIAHKP